MKKTHAEKPTVTLPKWLFDKLIHNPIISIEKQNVVYTNNKNGNIKCICPSRGGKTMTYLSPTIEIWGRCKNFAEKPHMVITDPKMELFRRHSNPLIKQGYKILCLNLKDNDMKYSNCYNPLSLIYQKHKKQIDKIRPYLDIQAIQESEWWLEEYYLQIKKIGVERNILLDLTQVETMVKSIGNILYPTDDKDGGNTAYFKNGGRNFFLVSLFYILDYSVLVEEPTKLSLANVGKMLNSNFVQDGIYSEKISKFSPAITGSCFIYQNQPKVESTENLSTFLQIATDELTNYVGSLSKVTAVNTIKLEDFLDWRQPIALFLITPDYESVYDNLVSLFLDQLLMLLCEKGDEMGGLKRPVEILADEFANFPKLNDIDKRLSVMLGRNVRMTIVVQNNLQLVNKYGKEIAETINSNIHHVIALGAKTDNDRAEISKQIGKTTIQFARTDGKKLKNVEPRWEEKEVDLVSSEMIANLEFGQGFTFGEGGAMIADLTPYFVLQPLSEDQTCKQYFENYQIPMVHLQLDETMLLFSDFQNPFGL